MKRTQTISHVAACLLALLLVLTTVLLCACSESEGDNGGGNTSAGNTVSGVTSSGPESNDVPPEKADLEGRVINIISWDFTRASIQGYTGEVIYSEEDDSSSVDVAKKAVVDYVETEYNCEIDGMLDNTTNYVTLVQNMVTTGTYDYDIIFTSQASFVSMAQAGTLTDLKSVRTINLSNSWWDQNAVEQLSIVNKLFYVNGDINTFDDLGTFCVLFNKSMKDRLSIEEDFYETARKGDWTLDHFMEICKGITTEYNGDGVLNELDQWALGTETYNVFVQVLGGGLHLIEKDDNDRPYIAFENNPQRMYSALDKIINFYQSSDVMVADDGSFPQYSNVWEETVNKAFREGRELFYMGGLFNLAAFREMDDDIGVLPIPKTFADQDSYYHTVTTGNTSYLAIPRNVPDVENLGLVIEALAMKSKELVTPAFYDTQLKYRDLRDDESGEMLDLIFATRSFDHGPAYNWGSILHIFQEVNPNYASKIDAAMDAIQIAMEDTIDLIESQ